MGHIFISYSHKDREYVHKLQEALQNEGFNAWIDDRIDYGDEWLKVIQKYLDECDAFIVVMSNNSFESDMVQNEVTRAREKKKPMFPLLLDGDNWLIVQAKQYFDVRNGAIPTEKFFKRLEMNTTRKDLITQKETREKALLEIEKQVIQGVANGKGGHKVAEKTAREKAEHAMSERPVQEQDEHLKVEPKRTETTRKVDKLLIGRVLGVASIILIGALSFPFLSNLFPKQPTATPFATWTSRPLNATEEAFVSMVAPSPAPRTATSAALLTEVAVGDTQIVANTQLSTSTKTANVSDSTKISPVDGASMIFVPASSSVDAFWMDKTAVTNFMFEKFVKTTNYMTDAEKSGIGFVWTNLGEQPATQFPGQTGVVYEWKLVSGVNWKNPSRVEWMGDGSQVLQVSWNDALAYCHWAGRELITIDEWGLARATASSAIFYNDRLGLGEWGEDNTTGTYHAVLGYQDIKWGYNTIFTERGFVEYRSANILTFRCKEK